MTPQLDDIAYRAKDQARARFTALAHHLIAEFLEETWQQMNQHGAPGLSGETMAAYDRGRGPRIRALVDTLLVWDPSFRKEPVCVRAWWYNEPNMGNN
jgi:hypothetical protein